MKTRGRRSRQAHRSLSEINVVPYIDVMLVLLVIFMITTPLLTQGVKVDLPKASAKVMAGQANKPIIVTVDAHGRYFLNVASEPNKQISPHDLAVRVAAEISLAKQTNSPRPVFVRGDANVDYGKVVQAMALLQQAGVPKVGLLTDQPATAKA